MWKSRWRLDQIPPIFYKYWQKCTVKNTGTILKFYPCMILMTRISICLFFYRYWYDTVHHTVHHVLQVSQILYSLVVIFLQIFSTLYIMNMFICVAGVVFYSTPHGGSQIAKLNSVVKYIFFPTVEVQELGEKTTNTNILSITKFSASLSNSFLRFSSPRKKNIFGWNFGWHLECNINYQYRVVNSDCVIFARVVSSDFWGQTSRWIWIWILTQCTRNGKTSIVHYRTF